MFAIPGVGSYISLRLDDCLGVASPLLYHPAAIGFVAAVAAVTNQAAPDLGSAILRHRNGLLPWAVFPVASLGLMGFATYKECWELLNGSPFFGLNTEFDVLVGLAQALAILFWLLCSLACGSPQVDSQEDEPLRVKTPVAYAFGVATPFVLTSVSVLTAAWLSCLLLFVTLVVVLPHFSKRHSTADLAISFISGLLLFALINDFSIRLYLDGVSKEISVAVLCLLLIAALMVPLIGTAANTKAPSSAVQEDVADLEEDSYEALAVLSPREKQVFIAWLQGKKNPEIAAELGLAVGTIATYRNRALEKLDIDSEEIRALRSGVQAEDAVVEVSLAPEKDGLFLWGPVLIVFAASSLLAVFLGGAPQSCLRGIVLALAICGVLCSDGKAGAAATNAPFPYERLWPFASGGLLVIESHRVASVFTAPQFFLSYLVLCAATIAVIALLIVWSSRPSEESLPFLLPDKKAGCLCFSVGLGLTYSTYSYSTLGLRPLTCAIILFAINTVLLLKTREELAVISAGCIGGEERALDYLRGRGLNELQARVILLTGTGRTRAEICDKLSVAPGTVNSCRATGYRMLGVHSISELRKLLGSEAGLSVS